MRAIYELNDPSKPTVTTLNISNHTYDNHVKTLSYCWNLIAQVFSWRSKPQSFMNLRIIICWLDLNRNSFQFFTLQNNSAWSCITPHFLSLFSLSELKSAYQKVEPFRLKRAWGRAKKGKGIMPILTMGFLQIQFANMRSASFWNAQFLALWHLWLSIKVKTLLEWIYSVELSEQLSWFESKKFWKLCSRQEVS